MRTYEIIQKKKLGLELSVQEIEYIVEGYTAGQIPDAQISALLMAVYFKGMTPAETTALTMAMVHSGDQMDLSSLPGIKVDKHSTGGVGDKTTLAVGPIVAALGVPVAKMSGRGLGHTGGTVDKLEAIPGLRIEIPTGEFLEIVKHHGICVTGQSGNFAPADKKIYALRDVTATVDSIPLIAASIMSKKIAAGADRILLDVKTGNGAFMKTLADSQALANAMVEIGEGCGRKTVALITDMSVPLGNAVGNYLEILEVIDVLKSRGPEDLTHLCIELSAQMLYLADKGSQEACRDMAKEAIANHSALAKFTEMIQAQGGDISYLLEEEEQGGQFPLAKFLVPIPSPVNGYIASMDTEGIGLCAMTLGAGREKVDDILDFTAGIMIKRKTGDAVEIGKPLAVLHADDYGKAKAVMEKYLDCLTFSDVPVPKPTLIYG
ncbi:MAG: pyrimidine-nucleoside phosphorylase [Defluviitaleaceae bacterium]|nr:pyrimidine-nucleoside phosphorylase [Defluviitaleaceae bacterium]